MQELGLEEKIPSKTTLEELEKLCADAFRYDNLCDTYESQAKEARIERDRVSQTIKSVLDHYQKTKFDSNSGTIEIRKKQSFKTPKTPEDKKALFEFLQTKGIFWEYVQVNSNQLNAFANEEYKAAKEENRVCFIPGLTEPTEYQTIAYRSKK